jgi:hypothetical protein
MEPDNLKDLRSLSDTFYREKAEFRIKAVAIVFISGGEAP